MFVILCSSVFIQQERARRRGEKKGARKEREEKERDRGKEERECVCERERSHEEELNLLGFHDATREVERERRETS